MYSYKYKPASPLHFLHKPNIYYVWLLHCNIFPRARDSSLLAAEGKLKKKVVVVEGGFLKKTTCLGTNIIGAIGTGGGGGGVRLIIYIHITNMKVNVYNHPRKTLFYDMCQLLFFFFRTPPGEKRKGKFSQVFLFFFFGACQFFSTHLFLIQKKKKLGSRVEFKKMNLQTKYYFHLTTYLIFFGGVFLFFF